MTTTASDPDTAANLRLILVLGGLVIAALFVSLFVGYAGLDVWSALSDALRGVRSLPATVLVELRLPRALLGGLVGFSLGLAGAAMQGLLRNPLAEPGVVGVFGAAALGTPTDSPDFVRITPADVHWQDIPGGHGAQQAVVLGDPDKPGIYVVRAKFPPYVMDHPHWHPNARYVTVLEGTWYTGTGGTLDLAKAIPLKAATISLR